MSELDIQQVLGSRYRTSQEADKYTDQLRQSLGLDTKAQVARLALGRSLGMGKLPDAQVDSKGLDIPAMSMFSPENIGAWLGLIVSHAISSGGTPIDSMEGLRSAIRAHWHRGAVNLWNDWNSSEKDYDRFIERLVRRSEMPDFADKQAHSNVDGSPAGNPPKVETPIDMSTQLAKALDELSIKVQVKDAVHGSRVTRYRVLLVNLSDLAKLKRSMSQLGLALNLGNALPTVSSGDQPKTVFIDLPRPKSSWVPVGIERLKDWVYGSAKDPNQLLLYAGVSVTGEDVSFDLTNATHLLVGGTTGSGKSICLHSFILSLLLSHKPESLQLALIDPKQVEFAPYAKLPNLYRDEIATETPQAREFLTELVTEMEARYAVFNRVGVTNLGEARRKGQNVPFIVVFIEEMADLVLQDDNIEPLIARLAQKARAAGIHLVLATQRPDADTFTGLIRSNIPGRIALTVQKGSESKIILDETGAEDLLGAGDMLIRMPGESPKRVHGVYVRLDNVIEIVRGIGK